MDYEKKLALAKDALDSGSYDKETIEYIFPELMESEDERMVKFIKKQLINIKKTITENYELDARLTKAIDWLEKQGNTDLEFFENSENEKREFVGYGFLKCKGDFLSFKEGENYWLEYVGKDNYNVRSDNLLGQTFHITSQQLYTVFRPTTWLEKQGEQKHIPWYDLEKSKEAGYTIVPNEEYDRLTKPAEWSEEDEKNRCPLNTKEIKVGNIITYFRNGKKGIILVSSFDAGIYPRCNWGITDIDGTAYGNWTPGAVTYYAATEKEKQLLYNTMPVEIKDWLKSLRPQKNEALPQWRRLPLNSISYAPDSWRVMDVITSTNGANSASVSALIKGDYYVPLFELEKFIKNV